MFRVQDTFGQWIGNADFQGALCLIVFFPFAFTPICDQELTQLNDRIREFDDIGVLAISCDPVAGLRAWQEQRGFAFDLASDFWPHGQAARNFGVFDEVRGYAKRASFLISPSGEVIWSVINPAGKGRRVDTYLEALAPWR